MSELDPNTLNRTLKIELDEGRARTEAEARALVRGHVLQIVVGSGIEASRTRQAMLVTALNCGRRAFIGGVQVQVAADATLSLPWHEGLSLAEVLERYGAADLAETTDEYPTIVIGRVASAVRGSVVLHPTWQGWSAGIVRADPDRLGETQEMRLAGILAAALAVSETFQHIRGSVIAGHRDVGLSLWDLEADWRHSEAAGPARYFLPDALWLAGLGHLGQAYAWTLGLLAYPVDTPVDLLLQDTDRLVRANEATALLAEPDDLPTDDRPGERKTRLVARRLEEIGLGTRIVERLFDEDTQRQDGEPVVLLGGFDGPEPRRIAEGRGFQRIFDAGLGSGTKGYLDIMIHTFPSQRDAKTSFKSGGAHRPREMKPAYAALLDQLVEQGMTEEAARCGIVDEIAGKSVAASFVGVTAACLVFAEILRDLRGAKRYALVDLSLREPEALHAEPLAGEIEPASYGSVTNAE